MIRFVNANADRKISDSRDQWSIMRYQTCIIAQMFSDGKGKVIQPTDIIKFDDEQTEAQAQPREITAEQSDKLNAAYERYLNRQ